MKFKETKIAAILTVVFVLVGSVYAADLTVPHTFYPGTAAKSSEVNANFTALKTAIDALEAEVRGISPGEVIQTVVQTSTTTATKNVTSFDEVHSDYRISITPKRDKSIFLVEFNFSISTPMANNTIFHMQLVRDPSNSNTLIGTGSANGSRQQTSFVSRPSNGYDVNDMQNVYMVGKDSGLSINSTYTYGFRYRREEGGSGTCYFNYSYGDSAVYGFSGMTTMRVTEIAQ